jgi:hypothetical protein
VFDEDDGGEGGGPVADDAVAAGQRYGAQQAGSVTCARNLLLSVS